MCVKVSDTALSPITGLRITLGICTITVIGENFGYVPTEVRCSLGSTISSAILISDHSLQCFVSSLDVGDFTLDIVTAIGDSVLEKVSNNTIQFYSPVDFHVTPSFGNINGGTVVSVMTAHLSIDDVMCHFSLSSESTSFDVVATQVSDTNIHMCISKCDKCIVN